MSFDYPLSARLDLVDDLQGIKVADPYRWLEDPDSAETIEWLDAQGDFAQTQLSQLNHRLWFHSLMTKICAEPYSEVVNFRAGWYWRLSHDGVADQPRLHIGSSLDELEQNPTVLLDPNTWEYGSSDAPTALSVFTVALDGEHAIYGYSESGSDWIHLRVLQLSSGSDLGIDVITKFGYPVWLKDSRSFCYCAFDDSGAAEGTETKALSLPSVKVHTLSVSASDGAGDPVLVTPDAVGNTSCYVDDVTDADWVILSMVEGCEINNRVAAIPADQVLQMIARHRTSCDLTWVIDRDLGENEVIGLVDGELFLLSSARARRGEIVAIDLTGRGEVSPTRTYLDEAERAKIGIADGFSARVVVPEQANVLEQACIAESVIIACYLADAQPVLARWGIDGENLGTLPISAGSVEGVRGSSDHASAYVSVSTVTRPSLCWRVDCATGTVSEVRDVAGWASRQGRRPEVTVTRSRATSADGTQVPYFVIRPKNGPDGPRPTLLYGYGGFYTPVLADYRPGWSGWLAAGGTLVIANLRGGGEFGIDWYEGGLKSNKQHVFDDFIAVADHLVETSVTTRQQLAIYGRSNGGLLIGATMTQRPDLCAAAIPQVGVLDVARFHKFTIGAAWISDYGDPDVAEELRVIMGYSPVHNVKPDTSYPATLILTGDHDDRVVPSHSYKFAAELQHCNAGPNPIVIRVERDTGHAAGKPLTMVAAEWGDLLAFAAHYTGLDPSRDGLD